MGMDDNKSSPNIFLDCCTFWLKGFFQLQQAQSHAATFKIIYLKYPFSSELPNLLPINAFGLPQHGHTTKGRFEMSDFIRKYTA